jgi:hypothetical protein
MTNATMKRSYRTSRSPLWGIAAVVATAMTMGIAVLMPMRHVPAQSGVVVSAAVPAQSEGANAPAQVVTLPPIEITASRPTKSAANSWWNVPAVFKQKS